MARQFRAPPQTPWPSSQLPISMFNVTQYYPLGIQERLKEGQLYYRLVRLSRADAPVMGPYRGPHPLPLFHNIRVASLMRTRILASVSPLQSPNSAMFSLISLEAASPAAFR